MPETSSRYTHEMRQRAFELRGQGMSFQNISDTLAQEMGMMVPQRTVANWCYSPDGRALIEELKAQAAAIMADRSNAVLPMIYDEIEKALAREDARAVDALSRSVASLTRGIVKDQIEVLPAKTVESPDELAAILARHGVLLSSGRTP